MRLSKQHKIYGAVLGLAFAAFGADRFVFSAAPAAESAESYAVTTQASPAATSAKQVVVSAMSTAVPPTKAADASAPVDDRRAISAKLDELAHACGISGGEAGNAFVPSPAWIAPTVVATTDDRARLAEERIQKFVNDHRLSAVMDGTGRHAVAIIDGKPVRPGQTLDGFKLASVSGRDSKAIFEGAGGESIVLRLSKTTAPAPAAIVAQAN